MNQNPDQSAESNKDKLMPHQFDGIQEYDNPIPLWMSFIFAGSIIFSIIYMVYYHGLDAGALPAEEYQQEMVDYEAFRQQMEASKPKVDLAALVNDQQIVEQGQQVYTTTCASCHGTKAEGLVGPGFRDTDWRNGDGSIESIVALVKNGVVDKGMPPWSHLGDDKIHQVSAFVFSLSHGNDIYGPMLESGQAPVAASASTEAATDAAEMSDDSASEKTFATVCAVCHGVDAKGGENLLGPDLTDDEWTNGDGSVVEIRKVIWNGVPAKGMPPWSSLGEDTATKLAEYVHSLGQ